MLLDKLQTIKLRPVIFTVHSWIGLIVGIAIAIMGLTGSGIVFMHELDHTLNPALMYVEAQGQPQSLAEPTVGNRSKYRASYSISPQSCDRLDPNAYAADDHWIYAVAAKTQS